MSDRLAEMTDIDIVTRVDGNMIDQKPKVENKSVTEFDGETSDQLAGMMTDGATSDQKKEVDGVNIVMDVDGETSDQVKDVDGAMSDRSGGVKVDSVKEVDGETSDLIVMMTNPGCKKYVDKGEVNKPSGGPKPVDGWRSDRFAGVSYCYSVEDVKGEMSDRSAGVDDKLYDRIGTAGTGRAKYKRN